MCFCDWFLFTYHNVSKIYICCNMYQYFIPFCGPIIFHCIDIPHFLYLFILWQVFGLFPFWSYCKYCYCEHLYSSCFVPNICAHTYVCKHFFLFLLDIYLGAKLLGQMLTLSLTFLKNCHPLFPSGRDVYIPTNHIQILRSPFIVSTLIISLLIYLSHCEGLFICLFLVLFLSYCFLLAHFDWFGFRVGENLFHLIFGVRDQTWEHIHARQMLATRLHPNSFHFLFGNKVSFNCPC